MPSTINATPTSSGLVQSADASGVLALQTGGTTAVTIDGSQNVGIGTTSPANRLDVISTTASTSVVARVASNASSGANSGTLIIGNGGTGDAMLRFDYEGSNTDRARIGVTTSNQALQFFTAGNNERMRITSTGLALFNSTSSTFSMPTTGGASFKGDNTGGGSPIVEVGNTNTTSGSDGSPAFLVFKSSATTSSSARFIQFSASGTGQQMGAIVGNGAGLCQFVNLSDAREKTNIAPLTNALARITALKPSTFNMISTNEHIAGGFIAQEVIKVFPEYVVENIANEGAEQRYGLTGGMTGGYIAVLTAAIQELKAELDSVKAELATLKVQP